MEQNNIHLGKRVVNKIINYTEKIMQEAPKQLIFYKFKGIKYLDNKRIYEVDYFCIYSTGETGHITVKVKHEEGKVKFVDYRIGKFKRERGYIVPSKNIYE